MKDIQARVNRILVFVGVEEKVRKVRTPEGAKRYGQPLGSVIIPDPIEKVAERAKRVVAMAGNDRVPNSKVPVAGPGKIAEAAIIATPKNVRGGDRKRGVPVPERGKDRSDGLPWGAKTRADIEKKLKTDAIVREVVNEENIDRYVKALNERQPGMGDDLRRRYEDKEHIPWVLAKVDLDDGNLQAFQYHVFDAAATKKKKAEAIKFGRDPETVTPVWRWQPAYYDQQVTKRGKEKYSRVEGKVAVGISTLSEHVQKNSDTDPVSAVIYCIMRTGMRPDTNESGVDSGPVGARTLRARHVVKCDVRNGNVTFKFPPGKGSKNDNGEVEDITVRITGDKHFAKMINNWWKDKDENAILFHRNNGNAIPYQGFNAKLRAYSGFDEIKLKDLRTLVATSMARRSIEEYVANGGKLPENKKQWGEFVSNMLTPAQQQLGHRDTNMTFQSYVNPVVWDVVPNWQKYIPASLLKIVEGDE